VDSDVRPVEQSQINPQTLGALLLHSTVVALAVLQAGRIVFANPAFRTVFGASTELTGVPLVSNIADGDADRLAEALGRAAHAPIRFFGTGRRGDGAPFDLDLRLEPVVIDGETVVVGFAWDVSEQHRSKEQLSYLAYSDPLTCLPNRAQFADRLHETALAARRHSTKFAVMMVDLDGFKSINDSYGHAAGDVALQLVAQRFQSCIREGDTLARIGGDEFAVLLPGLSGRRAPELVAERMIAALATPLELGAHRVSAGASVGIAVWPEHAKSVDALLAEADTAMYRAKHTGKNRLEWADGRAGEAAPSLPPSTWVAAHSVGIKAIDEQHLHLLELVGQLSAALRDGLPSDAIASGLDELTRYTAHHFATEERLMETYEVNHRARHQDEHRRLLHDIRALHADGETGSVSLILRYLHEWLHRHVDSLDRELGRILLAKGVR